LIGTLTDEPILIVAPKAVVAQWQGEIYEKLAAPSAVWTGKGWLTERNEFHPVTEDSVTKCPRKIAIVSTSVILSAKRSVLNGRLTEELLKKQFSCVLWDEAHKIRRDNVREPKVWGPPQMNLLYQWAMKLAARTRTMILATATPVQLHPVELWDLLNVLAVNNDQVLGSAYGRWNHSDSPQIFDLLAGRQSVDDVVEKWTYWKDPLPREEQNDVFRLIRSTLNTGETKDSVTDADYDKLDPLDQEDLDRLDVREINPFTIRVIKRSRERLEEDGKLVRIELVPVDDDKPVMATHSIQQALNLAEQFAKELHKKNTAGGFIKTLLQRRVGSSVIAGWKTASRMLEQGEVEDEEGLNENETTFSEGGIYPLTPEERDLLELLRDHLKRQLDQEDDPKFDRVAETLETKFDDVSWLERGVLIFSQFYDSAYALCAFLADRIDMPIGLYANSSSSKLFEDGKIQTVDRELLKEKVRVGALKVLVGTDAASTGLNLQTLGSLINLDLPWNPTTLEQRKGRVQRGTIAKRIPYSNLRYNEGVEQRLFNVLTGRIKEITDIFGTVPDFITDEWVDSLVKDRQVSEDDLIQMVTGKAQSPFSVKETYEYLDDEWESTVEVLNSKEAIGVFLEGW
jgi:superfamily II DNA or RNA helicase